MASVPVSSLPSIHLLCMEDHFITAFNAAKEDHKLPKSVNVTFHNERLAELDSTVRFDAIVSPANSYARMDGGFDDALSRAFSPQNDYLALSRVAQAAVYEEYRGFAPPGSCLLISLEGQHSLRPNRWGCKYLALCPTMKVPQNVTWDREVVYECIWTLLAAVDGHNRRVRESFGQNSEQTRGTDEIESVLMTPLATGYGGWSAEKWAAQTVLAIKHFEEAAKHEEKWKTMGPIRIMQHSAEVEETYEL